MIIEHSFITQLDAAVALARAQGLLAAAGYAPAPKPGDAWLEYQRGKTKRGVGPAEQLHRVRMRFDRQRIEVAIAAETVRKPTPVDAGLAVELATALQKHLGEGATMEAALGEWKEWHEVALERSRKQRINIWIVATILIIVIVMVLVMLVDAMR